jgi:hypothetical protein
VAGLEARRIDVDELGIVVGLDAGDAVARGLRLARVMLTLAPISVFISVDLPTLGRPTMAI